MYKFTSIESFKHIIANVRRYSNDHNKPFPTLEFEGTEKLHGSNGAVRRTPSGKIQPQSRERILDLQNDNAGFAAFVLREQGAFEQLFKHYDSRHDVTLFGEWCGGNIQKNVALAQLPKHFVLFKALVDGKYVPLPRDLHDNDHGIWNIYQIPTWKVTVDFVNPSPASDVISDMTLAVEEKSVWTQFVADRLGIVLDNTISEGIVWSAIDVDENLNLWFKTKGLLHKGTDKTKSPKIKIDDRKMDSIKELIDEILPQWRLEQGITQIKEMGLPILPESTGEYLKWTVKDALKEESETIAASGFMWKEIQGQFMQTARQYWLTEMNKVE